MKFNNDYSHKSYYDELSTVFDALGLIQLVDFETWRRSVNGVLRSSISDLRTSFIQLHTQELRALPMNFAKYKLAIQLFKIYNGYEYNDDWQDMNRQQNFNARSEMFQINDFWKKKNILCNRLTVLNRQVKLDWLSLTAFKLKAKNAFLTN